MSRRICTPSSQPRVALHPSRRRAGWQPLEQRFGIAAVLIDSRGAHRAVLQHLAVQRRQGDVYVLVTRVGAARPPGDVLYQVVGRARPPGRVRIRVRVEVSVRVHPNPKPNPKPPYQVVGRARPPGHDGDEQQHGQQQQRAHQGSRPTWLRATGRWRGWAGSPSACARARACARAVRA